MKNILNWFSKKPQSPTVASRGPASNTQLKEQAARFAKQYGDVLKKLSKE